MKNSNIIILYQILITALVLSILMMIQHYVMALQSSSISFGKGYASHTLVGSPNNVTSFKKVFKQVNNSVVQITYNTTTNNVAAPLTENVSLGSGFVYDKQGHIITSNRAIGNARIIDVTFVNGNRYRAKVIGTDTYNDIAVLQIQNISQQQGLLLKPLIIGNSSKMQAGDPVIAIGNPFGLRDSMLTGIVESQIESVLPDAIVGFSILNVIQTDIPTNPGIAGGPLLNLQGKVVGMNSGTNLVGAFLPDAIVGFSILNVIQTDIPTNSPTGINQFTGLGFSIPSNTITKVVPSLIEKGTYLHPSLGLKAITLTSDLAKTINNSSNILPSKIRGIYVDTITKNGPADKVGIHGSNIDQYSIKHGGDIITAIDGHDVTDVGDLISYIDAHKSAGDSVILSIYRYGHTLSLKMALTPK
jgi:S1-C subfamily serine protease